MYDGTGNEMENLKSCNGCSFCRLIRNAGPRKPNLIRVIQEAKGSKVQLFTLAEGIREEFG